MLPNIFVPGSIKPLIRSMEVNFLVLILINSPGLMTISWADVLVINIPLIWVNFLGNISVPLPIKVPCFALNFSKLLKI